MSSHIDKYLLRMFILSVLYFSEESIESPLFDSLRYGLKSLTL